MAGPRQLTRRQRRALHQWWPWLKIKIKGNDVLAQKSPGGAWGVLLTVEQARICADLIMQEQAK